MKIEDTMLHSSTGPGRIVARVLALDALSRRPRRFWAVLDVYTKSMDWLGPTQWVYAMTNQERLPPHSSSMGQWAGFSVEVHLAQKKNSLRAEAQNVHKTRSGTTPPPNDSIFSCYVGPSPNPGNRSHKPMRPALGLQLLLELCSPHL